MANSKCPEACLKFILQKQRLKGQYTDVTIICNDESTLHAHKAVLMGANSYFEKMFDGSFEEAKTGTVQMDFSPKTMTIVLDFIYLGDDAEIDLDDLDEADEVLRASDMLHMINLLGKCCTQATLLLAVQDFPRVADWYDLYKNSTINEIYLKKLLTNYLKKFSNTIVDSELYLKYGVQQFRLLVQSYQHRKERSMSEYVSTIIINWINFDQDERTQHTDSLFSLLNLINLSWSFVHESLLTEEFINTNCKVLMQIVKTVPRECEYKNEPKNTFFTCY